MIDPYDERLVEVLLLTRNWKLQRVVAANIEVQMKRAIYSAIANKAISVTDAATLIDCSREHMSALYNRYLRRLKTQQPQRGK